MNTCIFSCTCRLLLLVFTQSRSPHASNSSQHICVHTFPQDYWANGLEYNTAAWKDTLDERLKAQQLLELSREQDNQEKSSGAHAAARHHTDVWHAALMRNEADEGHAKSSHADEKEEGEHDVDVFVCVDSMWLAFAAKDAKVRAHASVGNNFKEAPMPFMQKKHQNVQSVTPRAQLGKAGVLVIASLVIVGKQDQVSKAGTRGATEKSVNESHRALSTTDG
jgi:hypothetical protein